MSMCENRNSMPYAGHDVRRIAREASAAPAASFKSRYRTLGIGNLARFHLYDNRRVNQEFAKRSRTQSQVAPPDKVRAIKRQVQGILNSLYQRADSTAKR